MSIENAISVINELKLLRKKLNRIEVRVIRTIKKELNIIDVSENEELIHELSYKNRIENNIKSDFDNTEILDEFEKVIKSEIQNKRYKSTNLPWVHVIYKKDLVYMWIYPLYNLFEVKYKFGTKNRKFIQESIESLDCFIEDCKQHKIPNIPNKPENRRCLVLKLSKLNSRINNWLTI